MAHEILYVAANCNQTPLIADWDKNSGLICYGSCNSILILDPNYGSGGKVIQCLTGHTKRVNAVRWIRSEEGNRCEVISGSTDGTAIVWDIIKGKKRVLKSHNSNVNLVDGIYIANKGKTETCTASMDGTVKIWSRKRGLDFTLRQTINYGSTLIIGLRLCTLPNYGNYTFLACAPDNSEIDIYFRNGIGDYKKGVSLIGHEDWVRGLDFTTDENGDILLASSSQDLFIRIWKLTIEKLEITYTVDSILTGHEGWIYSVRWSSKRQLLSASLDKTLIIWELENNLWVESVRLGEVGGNTLGFYGAEFNGEGTKILAHSYHGAFHIWKNVENKWEPCVTVGGHFAGVMDLSWEPQGNYLFTVSADQTTRIHAPWNNEGRETTWHEIARPQVHGYDMAAIAVFSRFKFASAAEEKVIRTFQAPTNFIVKIQRICNVLNEDFNNKTKMDIPKGASVPSLGLSNKAVFIDENKQENNDSHYKEVISDKPPTEEDLLQNTLWPEIQKLYGHGYEVYSLAASSKGDILASACKATIPEHAAILLWDTETWKLIQKLPSHNLTVVQMSFSPNGNHLLSVSRDRRWSIFNRTNENRHFELAATCDKTNSIHTRIIWCCAWSFDSKYFATGSREGKIVLWSKTEKDDGILGGYNALSTLDLKESVTAITFAHNLINGNYLIATGFEGGKIIIYKWNNQQLNWVQLLNLEQNDAHHLTVKRLSFRPNSDNLHLASCSLDFSVKIHQINILC